MEPWERAVQAIEARAVRDRPEASERLRVALPAGRAVPVGADLRQGRLTVNFHPDRIAAGGRTVAAGLAQDGRYHSQWRTWISSGGRSAVTGGQRQGWERQLFADAYVNGDPDTDHFPIYGALDLLHDPHGGSPSFGSCYLVLHSMVLDRTTLCVGDSHVGPSDVGTGAEALSIVAGLAEQAAQGRLLGRDLGLDAFLDLLDLLDDGPRNDGGPARVLDGYVEAQIHGGIDLSTDVEAVVVDPSFRGTDVETDLARVAETGGSELRWHSGSVLAVSDVPSDFRGPTMPAVARRVAGQGAVVDAHLIGRAAAAIVPTPPSLAGDPNDSEAQQLKYLWHTVAAHGSDAEPQPRSASR